MNTAASGFSSTNLYSRLLEMRDKQDVTALYANSKVTRYIDLASVSGSTDIAFSRLLSANHNQHKAGMYWGIFTKNDHFVGLQGLTFDPKEHHRAEIGIILDPDYSGVGMATEALASMITFAFTCMPITKLFAHFDARNISVKQLAERLNFDEVTEDTCGYSKQHWESVYNLDPELRIIC